jgi:hypothetical protein
VWAGAEEQTRTFLDSQRLLPAPFRGMKPRLCLRDFFLSSAVFPLSFIGIYNYRTS